MKSSLTALLLILSSACVTETGNYWEDDYSYYDDSYSFESNTQEARGNLHGTLPVANEFGALGELSMFRESSYDGTYIYSSVAVNFQTETGVAMIAVDTESDFYPGRYELDEYSLFSNIDQDIPSAPLWVLGCSGQDTSFEDYDQAPEGGVVEITEDPESGDLIFDMDLYFGDAGFSQGVIRVPNTY